MAREDVLIRPATSADVPQVAAIVRENPLRVYSDRGWQHRLEFTPERARMLALVADAAGAIVGYGVASLDESTSVEGAGDMDLAVAQSARGRRIGARLYDALLDHLRAIGVHNVVTHVVQEDAGIRFARARGFEQVKTAPIFRVDPRTVTLDLLDASDFRVVGFSDIRDRPRDLFDLDAVGVLDEPSVNPMDVLRYEEWEQAEWLHPDLELGGSSVVLSGDRMVSFSWLRVDLERGRGISAFTATHPEFRGRGLATRAKLRTMRWAAANGITSITTANDDSNTGMLAVNRRLGFAPIGALLTFQGDI